MPSGNWSFPCSPRNPAKVREELRLLAPLAVSWRLRGLVWSPRSGAQLEFGRVLRQSSASALERSPGVADAGGTGGRGGPPRLPEDEDPQPLHFQTQAPALSEDNLRWTARARFGTYKFFGFAATDDEGYATLTDAGQRFVSSPRPGEVLLRQLLKWQYPDNQHRGSRWPAEDFAIFPFVATARLIRELGGLSRRELALFCFTMRRTEEAAAVAEAIRQFRARQTRAAGRTGKARAAAGTLDAAHRRYAAEGRRVVLGSTGDYADALVRYFRYTGLFSVRGSRIVVANGRDAELDELIYPAEKLQATHPTSRPDGTPVTAVRGAFPSDAALGANGAVQLALGEAPPGRLAAPWPLFAAYADASAFYRYYGDAELPRLPWQAPERLAGIARVLDTQVAHLVEQEARARTGRRVLAGPTLGAHLPGDYESLVEVVDALRRRKRRLEEALLARESQTPQRLHEALDYYRAILAREVIDPPTFLEWNTWRVFLALNEAREIIPHLALDDDLQPLSTAQGNQPDLEVDYGDFLVVVEVTLRTGADQRQAEARPVTRHILEAQRRSEDRHAGDGSPGGRPVYGLFLAPKIHPDTAMDFFVALKYRVIERRQIIALPLTFLQFEAALRPFAAPAGSRSSGQSAAQPAGHASGHTDFSSAQLRRLLDALVQAAHDSETGDDWLRAIETALRRWLVSLGAPTTIASSLATGPVAVPLPFL